MEKKIEAKSDDEMEISDDPELMPLRIIAEALDRRIRVSTSMLEVVRNNPDTIEFVAVEGNPDRPTLEILKESLADLFTFPENKNASFISQDPKSSIHSCSETQSASKNISKSSSYAESEFSIPSCTASFDGSEPSLEALRKAEEAIRDTDRNGPSGLVQMSSLSAAIDKPIRIRIDGKGKTLKVGGKRDGEPIDVEYHEAVAGQQFGHFTLPGNVDPEDVEGKLNDCLYNVIAAQTGNLAPELRAATAELMRKNLKPLAKRIKKIVELEKCDRISFMIGGAKYNGKSPEDAARVIDKSQTGGSHPRGYQGHPRGHASFPEATGFTESVENYSHSGRKSGFLSRQDQDAVGHLALQTQQARRAMKQLNSGAESASVHLLPQDLETDALPECAWFSYGQRDSSIRPFRELVLVLRHQERQKYNPSADVFIQTFFPKPQ